MSNESGFSLVEVLVALVVWMVILLGLLHGLVLASRVFLLTEERFHSTIDRWNQAQSLYPDYDPAAPTFRPCSSCLPVVRSNAVHSEVSWEVLHGR